MALSFTGLINSLFEASEEERLGFSRKIGETLFWSVTGHSFIPAEPDVMNVTYLVYPNVVLKSNATDGYIFQCPVNLPQGAVITGVVVYGTAGMQWEFLRVDHTGGDSGMADATTNSEDTSINHATVDNQNYSYVLTVGEVDNTNIITGARITYQF